MSQNTTLFRNRSDQVIQTGASKWPRQILNLNGKNSSSRLNGLIKTTLVILYPFSMILLQKDSQYTNRMHPFVWVISAIKIDSLPSKETSSARLATNLRRVFQERGIDFFDRDEKAGFGKIENAADAIIQGSSVEGASSSEELVPKAMTMEELYNMKSEILPQLL